jgi:exopolysaccharide production protein ExoQ
VAIAVLSFFWSDAPELTLRRSIALVGTSLFGVYFASRYSIKQQLQLLGWTFGIAIVLSLIFVVAVPHYGIAGGIHAGAWRGIYSHKNGLAKKMVMSTIVFLLLTMNTTRHRWLMLGGVSLSIVLLILARSTTALATMLLVLSALPLYRALRWRYSVMLPGILAFLTVAAIGGLWVMNNLETVLTAVGEDMTLTGRIGIWPAVLVKIQERPWLGYGYEAFWRGLNGESAYIYLAGLTPSHAHNGLLQLWLHVGLLGVFVFLIGFWATLLKAAAWARLSTTATGFWPLLYLTFMVPLNFAESSIMKYNEIDWVLYVAIALSLLKLPELEEDADPALQRQSTQDAIGQLGSEV